MTRRAFLSDTAYILAALALLTNFGQQKCYAQNWSSKPYIKRSEIKPDIAEYVERVSEARKRYIGVGLSNEQKAQMAHDILEKMEAQGSYAYVDP